MTDTPLVRNAADPEQVQRAAEYGVLDRRNELDDLRSILSSPAGKRLFWRLLQRARIFTAIFTGEAMSTAHAEGERNLGLWLLSELNDADPEALATLVASAAQRRALEQARRPDPDTSAADEE